MKKYRLKQWYPRIPVYLEDGYVISFDDNKGIAIYEFVNGTLDTFEMSGAELECTQYWELIEEEKPLFVTEDGVNIIRGNKCFAVDVKSFIKCPEEAYEGNYHNFKYFFHESNADEYIWRNKRLFSYNDIEKFQSGGEGTWWNVEAIAKGRSKQ